MASGYMTFVIFVAQTALLLSLVLFITTITGEVEKQIWTRTRTRMRAEISITILFVCSLSFFLRVFVLFFHCSWFGLPCFLPFC